MKHAFCFVLVFLSCLSFSQRADMLLAKTERLISESNDSASYFINQLDQLISKDDPERYYELLVLKSIPLKRTRKNEEAIALLQEADQLAKTEEQKAKVCVELGTNFLMANRMTEGSEALTCALSYYEYAEPTEETQKLLLRCYGNLGLLKREIRDFDASLTYFQKAIDLSSPGEKNYYSLNLNKSSIYNDKGNYKKAIEIGEQLRIEVEQMDKYEDLLSLVYSNLCNDYRKLDQFDKAIYYGEKAVALREELDLNPITAKNNLAISFINIKEYQKALDILLTIKGRNNSQVDEFVLANISECYANLDKPKEALHYSNLRIDYRDSIADQKLEERVTQILAGYESEKKEEEIKHLSHENELKYRKLKNQRILMLASIIVFLLLNLLGYAYYRYQKQKQDLQKATIQNKLLHSQLNPHFLFHSLQNIQSFIYQNDKEKSLKYLNNYSHLIRSIFDTSDEDFITIEQDSETIKDYISLQKLNYDHSFDVDFHVDESIGNFSIPPLIVQPYVENAIIHGLKNNENGHIAVKYLDRKEKIVVVIEDNGNKGNKISDSYKLKRNSSTKVIKKRLEQLAKGHDFDLDIEEDRQEDLYTVTISFDKTIRA